MNDEADPLDVTLDGFPVAARDEEHSRRETLESLVSEFVERTRAGERPSPAEYAARHPDLAEQLRECLPVVAALERWKIDKETECLRRGLPDELSISQLGDCRILHEIGRGGMGVVFEARQGAAARPVAVKLLPWRFASSLSGWRERFQQEARTIARLRHRHIVPVFGLHEQDGYCFYVMRLIEGVSLDWIIRRLRETDGLVYADEVRRARRRFSAGAREADGDAEPDCTRTLSRDSWTGFAKIAAQVAEALHYAHGQGVLHNDVKPGNVLLDCAGRVFVTDFGIASGLDQHPPDQETRLTGTLRYMAPERFRSRSDERSDVYSLGLTLYELATLEPAFAAQERPTIVEDILQGRIRDPSAVEPRIPRDLETVILTALATDPAERYPSAAELAADLLRFINGDDIHAARAGLLRRLMSRWRTRRQRSSA